MKDFEELTLELTDCCPLHCLHCSSNSSPECKNCLPEDIIKNLIDEAVSLGVRKISLGGGEPTIAQSFGNVISYLSQKKISVEILTSGLTNFHRNIECFPDDFVRNFISYSAFKLIFSLYGSTPEIHDLTTQIVGSFQASLQSIKKSLDAEINCELNYVPLRINKDCFEELIDLANSLGIKKISILRFVPQGRGHKNKDMLEMSFEEEEAFVEKLLRLKKESGIEIRTGSPFNSIIPGNNIPCRAGFAKLVVQANGNVLPCEVFKHHNRCNWKMSVYKHSLRDILQSRQIKILESRLKKSNCFDCPIHSTLRRRQFEGVLNV